MRLDITLLAVSHNDINRYIEETKKELQYILSLCSYSIVYKNFKDRLLILLLHVSARRRCS